MKPLDVTNSDKLFLDPCHEFLGKYSNVFWENTQMCFHLAFLFSYIRRRGDGIILIYINGGHTLNHGKSIFLFDTKHWAWTNHFTKQTNCLSSGYNRRTQVKQKSHSFSYLFSTQMVMKGKWKWIQVKPAACAFFGFSENWNTNA